MAEEYKIEDVLALAKLAAVKAGEFVGAARWKNFVDHQKSDSKIGSGFMTKASSTDVVTETDQKSEELITGLIREKFPTHKIIGEESSTDGYVLTEAPTWIIDPIDGTTNFLHGIPYTCILICFADKKEIRMAVMRDAIHSETFYATKGGGCHLECAQYSGKVHTSGCEDLKNAYVAVDAGYGRSEENAIRFYSRFRELMKNKTQGIRVFGSCGMNMAYVACGRIDGYVEESCPKIWDFAGGSLMVSEAGGFVSDPSGSSLDLMKTSILVAGSKKLGAALIDVVKNAKKYSCPN